MTLDLGEFACRCGNCDTIMVSRRLIAGLEELNKLIEVKGRTTSGFRCNAHNFIVGGHPRSLHMRGMAIDLSIRDLSFEDAIRVAEHVHVFKGIGIYWPEEIIHLDIRLTRSRWGRLHGRYTTMEEVLEHGKA